MRGVDSALVALFVMYVTCYILRYKMGGGNGHAILVYKGGNSHAICFSER